jgi:glycosyltransferase involved in cell wall biosynthesis
MKVLHVISSGGMYGAEAVILNLSRTLNRGSHRSILGVFSNLSNPNHHLHEIAVEEGIESHLISCKSRIDRTAIASIRELALRTDADIVHAHGYKADIYVYFALRGVGVPFVSTCHTWYDNDLSSVFYGAVDRFVLRRYARVVAVSDEVKRRLLKAGVREREIHLIRNGIELRPFDEAVPSLRENLPLGSSHIVGLIGRLASEKGIDIFLRAAALVLVEFPRAQFVVVGDGPDRDELERLIVELNIRESVSMLGHRDDMPSVYASLDVMVSSSRQEGLPMAILEGMASKRPLVATAVGEVPTVVLDGRTGVLVPAGDVNLLAAGILELLRDPAKRTRLGMAARQLIEEEYSAARMAADYHDVYAEAILAVKKAGERRVESSTASQGNVR